MQEGKVIYSLEGPLPWEKLGYAAGGPGAAFESTVRSDPRIHNLIAKLGHPHALLPPLNLEVLREQGVSISVCLEHGVEAVVFTPEMNPEIVRVLKTLSAIQSALQEPLLIELGTTEILVTLKAKEPAQAAAPAVHIFH